MKFDRIQQLAQKYMQYPMIQAHTKLPELSHLRLRLLYEGLQEHSNHKDQGELYTLATALVQLGMDTHDGIDTRLERRTEQEMRTRQIRVLSGDYFSALFYQLLAKAGHVELITELSRGVCEVNRLKIDHYLRMKQFKLLSEDYIEQMVSIRSELFQMYDRYLNGSFAAQWPELLRNVSRCELLIEEAERTQAASGFERSWAFWYVMDACTDTERQKLQSDAEQHWNEELMHKYNVREQLRSKLKLAAASFHALSARVGLDELYGDIKESIDKAIASLEASGAAAALNEMR